MAQFGSNLAPTWPPKSLQDTPQDDVKKATSWKAVFLQPLHCEMQVFAPPRGSQNEQKRIPRPLLIRVPFQLKKIFKKKQASILLQFSSLLGFPRRPQEASKASWKPLLEASWAIWAASSNLWPPKGRPKAQSFSTFDQFVMAFKLLLF